MLVGGWEVTVGAVGEFDDEGVFEGALLLELETNLNEDFEGEGDDGLIADADGLDEDGFGEALFLEVDDLAGVLLGFLWVGLFAFFFDAFEGGEGAGYLGLVDLAVGEGNFALAGGDERVVGVLEVAGGAPGGVGGLGGDDAALLEGLAGGALDAEGEVVDVEDCLRLL